jgi:hypothetical protein
MKRMEEIQGTKQSYEDILSNRNVPEHWHICPIFAWGLKFRRGRILGFVFTTIHEQPFPPPHDCGMWPDGLNVTRWSKCNNTILWWHFKL